MLFSKFKFTEKELIEHLQSSDSNNPFGINRRKAEEQLFNDYDYFVRNGMKKFSLTEDEVKDAYTDSIVSAIQAIVNRSFRGEASLKTYIYQIFHRKCIDQSRKGSLNKNMVHRTSSILEMLPEISDKSKSILERLDQKSDLILLQQCMKELNSKERKIVDLWAFYECSDAQIASEMCFNNAAVAKTTRYRCLEKLKKLFIKKVKMNLGEVR